VDPNERSLPTPGEPTSEAELRLIPIIARVIELGRGPPGLVWWVQNRLLEVSAAAGTYHPLSRKPIVRWLAYELAQALLKDGLRMTHCFGTQGMLDTIAAALMPRPDRCGNR
jgi:hypothetical protein